MRVLLSANHFNTGGITSYLMTLSRALIARGAVVFVASSGGNMVPELEALGARHVQFSFDLKCEVHPRMLFLALRLAAFARDEKIDIIHAQTRVTQMAAALASKRVGAPFVSTCHGFFKPHLGRRLLPLWGDRVIAISGPVKENLMSAFHVPDERIVLIPNGIDLGRFIPPDVAGRSELRRKWGVGDEPTLGMIARLSDVKGHEYLIEAMPLVLEKVPQAKCFLFGDGPLEAELKARVRAKGLEGKILFYPVVNRTAEVLPLLDVFVTPSVQEGLGLSVMEAGAMGLPCVASRVGGLPDVVKDGETGLLVPPKDPQALAAALVTLLTDKPRARAMGEKARAFVTANFSDGPMADATLAMYKDVLELKHG